MLAADQQSSPGFNPVDDANLSQNAIGSEEMRISLLDVVRTNLQKRGKQHILFRVVVCGELILENLAHKQDLGGMHRKNGECGVCDDWNPLAYYQQYFKSFQTDQDMITGLLLVYQKSFVHVVEGTLKVVQGFTRGFRTLLGSDKPLIRNVRVLQSSNDVPKRYFPFWASRVVEMRTMEATGDLDPTVFTQDRIVDLVLDCSASIKKLGHQLTNTTKMDMKAAVDELYSDHKNLLPRQEVLSALANTDEIMAIEEWLSLYDSHTDLVLDGGMS